MFHMHEEYGADSPKSKRASVDFARLMEPVAIALLGPPNKALSSSTELRWGTRGSMSVDPVKRACGATTSARKAVACSI
jgi:hypothetical protein